MSRTITRAVVAILVAATGMYYGISLAKYADADDSPGGMVIGFALMFGALALGLWIAFRAPRTSS